MVIFQLIAAGRGVETLLNPYNLYYRMYLINMNSKIHCIIMLVKHSTLWIHIIQYIFYIYFFLRL